MVNLCQTIGSITVSAFQNTCHFSANSFSVCVICVGSGIRPKLSGPGETAADFVIESPHTHGVSGVYNLLGIESPGLTSSLALGDMVAEMVASDISK